MFSVQDVKAKSHGQSQIWSSRDSNHFKYIESLVTEKGIKALYEEFDELLRKNIFFSNEDLLYLFSLDKEINLPIETIAGKNNNVSILPIQKNRHAIVKEKNGEGMEYIESSAFKNWQGNIRNTPAVTFVPKTIKGLQNLVSWCKKNDKRLRACGYRHSASDVYSEDEQILVSMLDIETATHLPARFPEMNKNSDLQGIKLIGKPFQDNGKKKIKCKVGAATCNYHLLDWIHDEKGGNSEWTLPLNVIMEEITLGGSNAPICHGAGIQNKTLSDLVVEIEFVNAHGEVQTVNDPQQLKAAAGCFGLLGIVVSITLLLEEMTYANLNTVEKSLLSLAIPPPKGYQVSEETLKHLSEDNKQVLSDEDLLAKATDIFLKKCLLSDYSEFFWFPFRDQVWVNCWRANGQKEQAERYPNPLDETIQKLGSYLIHIADGFLDDQSTPPFVKKTQTQLFGAIAMQMLPDKPNITCTKHDALHFQKGIQNIPTKMFEVEIPIPKNSITGQPDLTIVQQAWWAVIESVYSKENMEYFPMRTTLEMRIMGGSDVLMAPQWNNELTCAIEVLTPVSVNTKRWKTFLQEILDKWCELKNDQGHFLNIRPHWAKEFDSLVINRPRHWVNEWNSEQKKQLKLYLQQPEDITIPINDYLKYIAYYEQLPLFLHQLKIICKKGGYSWKEAQERFSNPFLSELIYSEKHYGYTHKAKQKLSHFRLFQCCTKGVDDVEKKNSHSSSCRL